jgi:hypothetical protein
MGFIDRVAQQRRELIERQARPFLEPDEDVIHWVRARRATGRGEGFLFVTRSRCVIAWSGRSGGDAAPRWRDIASWGVVADAKGGPILGIEGGDEIHLAQIVVTTGGQAQEAKKFVRHFSNFAPRPEAPFRHAPEFGPFDTNEEIAVYRARPSVTERTRDIVLTVLGVALLTLGIALLVLPGPGLLVVIAGLAVLARRYDWAKDLAEWTKDRYSETKRKVMERRRSRAGRDDAGRSSDDLG